MDSDLQRQHHQFQNPQQQQQQQQQQHVNSGGLTRYRSAPSSYFANFDDHCEGYLHVRPSSPETEQIVARFMSENSSSPELPPEFVPPMKHEPEVVPPQLMYQSSSRPPLPNQSSTAAGSETDRTNLIRQSSSPAGLFSHPNVDNGYGVMRGMENFGSVDGTNREPSLSSASRLKGQINFSSGPPSSSGHMSHMSNIGNKGLGEGNSPPDDGSNNESYLTGFPVGSWEDHSVFSENFNGLKRSRDDDKTFLGFNASDTQHGEPGNHPPTLLSRHMSLPKTSAEIASVEKYLQFQDSVEKYLQFQDSVPCKIRAKRGCATHPRSIAERVRRTRISERMRKLQDLVPNMDKQTSTADMLNLAVEYIKALQKQVETLSDHRAKCTCNKRKT